MRRPKRIVVMGVPFRVEWDHHFEDGTQLGETDGGHRVIRIASHKGREGELASTLLHELMHAVLYVSGMEDVLDNYRKELDETVVTALEHGLFPLLETVRQAK